MCKLNREEAEKFYQIHRCQPFFPDLVEFMTSSCIVALELLAPGKLDQIYRLRSSFACQ